MSTGLVICSECKREVHQWDEPPTWSHCDDGSPRCEGASSIFPESLDQIIGQWCGRDGTAEQRRERPRQVIAVPGGSIAALMGAMAMMPAEQPTRYEVKPLLQRRDPRVDPQDVADRQRENLKIPSERHEHNGERARRRRAAERQAAKLVKKHAAQVRESITKACGIPKELL